MKDLSFFTTSHKVSITTLDDFANFVIWADSILFLVLREQDDATEMVQKKYDNIVKDKIVKLDLSWSFIGR